MQSLCHIATTIHQEPQDHSGKTDILRHITYSLVPNPVDLLIQLSTNLREALV
jgi:hypothetical protein